MIDATILFCLSPPHGRMVPGFHGTVDSNHRPLLECIERMGLPCALSVPWGLTELWLSSGHHDCVAMCQRLHASGRVEFVSTAAYHPILPLLPRNAMGRQVADGIQQHSSIFTDWSCRGFVPPEMAFGPELLPVLQELSFDWCMVDDAPYCCLSDEPPFDYVPLVSGLRVLLRSALWSRALVGVARAGKGGRKLVSEMVRGLKSWFDGKDGYVCLAMDAECFGHHRRGSLAQLESFLKSVQRSRDMSLVFPTQIVERFPSKPDEVPPGSWRTTSEQFWEGEFFAPWQSRYNSAHKHLWELTELAVGAVAKMQQRLDRGLHAGLYWDGRARADVLPSSSNGGLRTLIDVIAAAAPEDLDRGLELLARLDEFR